MSVIGNIGTKEKESVLENLVMLTASGMDLVTAFDVILGDLRSPKMKKIVEQMKKSIIAGEPLHMVTANTKIFKPYISSLIHLGEQSGRLFQNLQVVVSQQQKDRLFQSRLRSALIYPLFVLITAMVVGLGVAWFILPTLASVFSSLKVELPLITKILIGTGLFLKQYGIIAIPAIAGFIALVGYIVFVYPKTQHIGQAIVFNMPGLGKLIQEIELARTGYMVGTLLEAGVPIVFALQSLSDTATMRPYRAFYTRLKAGIENGDTFKKTFNTYIHIKKIFPIAIQQMLVAGEQSGRLPETFLRIGKIYEEKTEDTSKNLTVLLEPILLLVVWLAVLGVALAVIMPIYSLIGGLYK